MFTKMWRDSVRLSSFKLEHPALEDFTTCCWQKSKNVKAVWLAYRIAIGLYFLVTLIYAFCYFIKYQCFKHEKYKFLIFLTHWTYILETFLFCLAAIMTIIAFKPNKNNGMTEGEDKLPWYYKMYWCIYTVALSASAVVTVMHWSVNFDPAHGVPTPSSIMLHVFNSVLMVIDFVLIAHPIRFFHFYFPFIYAILYVLFSVIYELSGKTGIKGNIPIYKVLDWKKKPKVAFIITTVATVMIVTMHILYSLLSLAKMVMRKKCITE